MGFKIPQTWMEISKGQTWNGKLVNTDGLDNLANLGGFSNISLSGMSPGIIEHSKLAKIDGGSQLKEIVG